jgi:hypothetical protein
VGTKLRLRPPPGKRRRPELTSPHHSNGRVQEFRGGCNDRGWLAATSKVLGEQKFGCIRCAQIRQRRCTQKFARCRWKTLSNSTDTAELSPISVWMILHFIPVITPISLNLAEICTRQRFFESLSGGGILHSQTLSNGCSTGVTKKPDRRPQETLGRRKNHGRQRERERGRERGREREREGERERERERERRDFIRKQNMTQ